MQDYEHTSYIPSLPAKEGEYYCCCQFGKHYLQSTILVSVMEWSE